MIIELFTTRYQQFRPGMGVPIRTSNGAPRWKLKYPIDHVMKELAPDWATMRYAKPEFTEAYFGKLDKVGPTTIAMRFRAIAETENEHRLVLLCFEDLAKPGQWCHRTIFADWWLHRVGDEVREIGPIADPVPTQGGLF
jgi:hypothetical protein